MPEGSHPDRHHPAARPRATPALLGKLARPGTWAFVLGTGLAGCDLDYPAEVATGRPLHLVATLPMDGDGTECDFRSGDDCGVPRDAALELRFDRYLLPATAVRQSLRVFSGSPDNSVFLEPEYDLVERVVRFRPRGGLWEPGLLYTVELHAPESAIGTFRAFDGATLEDGPVPSKFAFRARRAAPMEPLPARERAPGCAEILDIFQNHCAASTCHASGGAVPMGLRLDSAAAIADTAMGRVARQTETGPEVGRPLIAPQRMGTQMPILDPGRSANSYLMYKLLLNIQNFGVPEQACQSAYGVSLEPGRCLPASADERQQLQDWFVRSAPMPPPGSVPLGGTHALRALERFIDEGADFRPCLGR